MARPTREQLQKWYDSLQAALIAGHTGIDLNNPADRALFSIMNIVEDPNPSSYADVESIDEELAFVKDGDKYDHLKTPPDLLLEDIEKGKPSEDMIYNMYKAAEEGRLFIRQKFNDKDHLPRQIFVDENGKASLGEDINYDGPNRNNKILDAVQLMKPTYPEGPGLKNWILGFFGNKAAQREIQKYRLRQEVYNQKLTAYNEAKKTLKNVPQSTIKAHRNFIRAIQNFFNRPMDVDHINRLARFNNKVNCMDNYLKAKDSINANLEILTQSANPPAKNEATKELFAKMACLAMLDNRLYGQMSNSLLVSCPATDAMLNFVDLNNKTFQKMVTDMKSNPTFNENFEKMSQQDLNKAFNNKCVDFTKQFVQDERNKVFLTDEMRMREMGEIQRQIQGPNTGTIVQNNQPNVHIPQ